MRSQHDLLRQRSATRQFLTADDPTKPAPPKLIAANVRHSDFDGPWRRIRNCSATAPPTIPALSSAPLAPNVPPLPARAGFSSLFPHDDFTSMIFVTASAATLARQSVMSDLTGLDADSHEADGERSAAPLLAVGVDPPLPAEGAPDSSQTTVGEFVMEGSARLVAPASFTVTSPPSLVRATLSDRSSASAAADARRAGQAANAMNAKQKVSNQSVRWIPCLRTAKSMLLLEVGQHPMAIPLLDPSVER